MHCTRGTTPVDTRTPVGQVRSAAFRVGDRERERTAVLLTDAAAAGLLTLAELDDRLARAWRAGTGAELSALEDDLPTSLLRERDRREAAARARELARAGLGPHVASYLGVMALLTAIWLLVGLAGGGWYPWPVWPALGWGIGVVSHARAARVQVVPSLP